MTVLDAAAIRGITARRVYKPSDAVELAAILHASANAGEAVVLAGGGTLQAVGNAPQRLDAIVRTRGLANVDAYDPRDLTIGAGAGMTLDRLAAVLGEHRQFVPIDAPYPARGTIGGALAAGWLGPRRGAYGRARDLVIGMTAALTDGTLAKSGGMVVKNVTGYDVGKLYVGSIGTLGAIARVNFKTLPLPAAARAAIVPFPEGTRERALAHLGDLAIEPACALVVSGFSETLTLPRGTDGVLFVLFEGSETLVDRATRELRSSLGAAGVPETRLVDRDAYPMLQACIDTYVATTRRSLTFRILGRPSEVVTREAEVRDAVRGLRVRVDAIGDVLNGDLIVRLTGVDAVAMTAALRERFLNATVIAGDESVLALVDAWGAPPPGFPAMRALKERFDPRATLAPGRFLGGL